MKTYEELADTITQAIEVLAILDGNGCGPGTVPYDACLKVLTEASEALKSGPLTDAELQTQAKANKSSRRQEARQAAYGGPNGEEPCSFCEGGHQAWNSHVAGGICFRCNGQGY